MEIRRGTLRQYLHTHLPSNRVDHVMNTLEPYFKMVQEEVVCVTTSTLTNFESSSPKSATPPVRESLVFALLQSFMKDLMSLMDPKIPNPGNTPGKKLFSLIFEWILYEFTSEDDPRRTHLHSLVQQAATPA